MDSTAATAWSIDGMSFRLRSPIRSAPPLGSYVGIATTQGQRLGQVLAQSVIEYPEGMLVDGEGRLIDHGRDRTPFDASVVTSASTALIRDGLATEITPLEIGTLVSNPEVPAVLDPRAFNRHSFLCGQSGSGKTYALGVLLERLLLRTRLPLLVLDPNGDHVHLGRPRPDISAEVTQAYAAAADGIRILRADAEAADGCLPLRIRFSELGEEGAAALLRLEPIDDRDEYNALLHVRRQAKRGGFHSVEHAFDAFRASGEAVLDLIRKRAENLGVDRMAAWAGDCARTLTDVWDEDQPRALVADTAGFDGRRERVMVAVAVLQQLWVRRTDRRPLLLVVDEAHDVCPAEPIGPLQRLAVELFTRIAGEGRKYGIHLLLASQRPDKLPESVLSQCDNLLLMRVNSVGDRAALADLFGFAPRGLVERAGSFGLGETLVAGRIAPAPLIARVAPRLTPEGGADIPTDWAG